MYKDPNSNSRQYFKHFLQFLNGLADQNQMNPATMPPNLAALFSVGVLGFQLIFLVIISFSHWKVFEKAGEPGWKALIPIYNYFVLCKISGISFWKILIPIVNLYYILVQPFKLARKFGFGFGIGLGILVLPFIFLPILALNDAEYHSED